MLNRAESGGLFVGGRTYRVNINGATCEQRFVRFLVSENSRHRNADGVPVKSSRKAVPTRSSTSLKLYSSRKRTLSHSRNSQNAGLSASEHANVNPSTPKLLSKVCSRASMTAPNAIS